MASISDVAKLAGVSVATVSRVMNQSGPVHPLTQQRVREAITTLNYEPNVLARNFRRVESRVVLIVTPNITNPYYGHIITGIGDQAGQEGYSALIVTARTKESQEKALNMLSSKQADGAILLAAEHGASWLEDYHKAHPIVLCSEFDPDTTIPHISIDNYKAGREIMDYLLSLGHRKIATISSENGYNSTILRRNAYKDAMKDAGLPIHEGYIHEAAGDYSFHSGKESIKHLLCSPHPPTAVFCISDTLALGSIIGAQELGYNVPKDLSVVGFDDVENTTMIHPYITTISQPCYQLGRSCTEKLCAIIRGELSPIAEVLPYQLQLRESTTFLDN